jgi:hypothetical protein
MTIQVPEAAVAVDPNQVALELRQMHAQQLDGLTAEVAALRVALRDSRSAAQEMRIKAEELGAENAQLREENTRLRAGNGRAKQPARAAAAAKAAQDA